MLLFCYGNPIIILRLHIKIPITFGRFLGYCDRVCSIGYCKGILVSMGYNGRRRLGGEGEKLPVIRTQRLSSKQSD